MCGDSSSGNDDDGVGAGSDGDIGGYGGSGDGGIIRW